jgi:hypothetical protein
MPLLIALALIVLLAIGDASAETAKISGSGTVAPQLSESRVTAPDNAQHVMTVSRRVEPNRSNMPNCETMQVELVQVGDMTAGSGFQRGHRTSTCADGDKWFSTYVGTVKTVPTPGAPPDVTAEGRWEITGGTGRYVDSRGTGTYKAA